MSTKIYNRIQNNFTQVSNLALLDTRLSSKAYKLYAYMCYRIGTSPDWYFNEKEILKNFKETRDPLRAAFKELSKSGWLVRKRTRKSDGSFGTTEYEIFSEPQAVESDPRTEKPSAVKPSQVKPSTEKPSYNNKDLNNKDSNKKDLISLKTKKEITALIERDKLNLDVEKFYPWYEIEMAEKGLNGSLLNVMRSMAEKPRNQLKKSAINKMSAAEEKMRRQIKSVMMPHYLPDHASYFAIAPIDGNTIIVKDKRALKYREILEKINIKIELIK